MNWQRPACLRSRVMRTVLWKDPACTESYLGLAVLSVECIRAAGFQDGANDSFQIYIGRRPCCIDSFCKVGMRRAAMSVLNISWERLLSNFAWGAAVAKLTVLQSGDATCGDFCFKCIFRASVSFDLSVFIAPSFFISTVGLNFCGATWPYAATFDVQWNSDGPYQSFSAWGPQRDACWLRPGSFRFIHFFARALSSFVWFRLAGTCKMKCPNSEDHPGKNIGNDWLIHRKLWNCGCYYFRPRTFPFLRCFGAGISVGFRDGKLIVRRWFPADCCSWSHFRQAWVKDRSRCSAKRSNDISNFLSDSLVCIV